MLTYVLTFMLVGGPSGPTRVEVTGLRSVEHCAQVARERRSKLPRNVRLVNASCVQHGYLT